METSTEGVTETAADDTGAAKAVTTAPATVADGQQGPDPEDEHPAAAEAAAPTGPESAPTTAADGHADSATGAPPTETAVAAQPGTGDAEDPTTPTGVTAGQQGADAKDEDPAAAAAARPTTGDAPTPTGPGNAPTATAHGHAGTAHEAPAAETAVAAQPGTADATTPTAFTAGQQGAGTAHEDPGAAQAPVAAQSATSDAPNPAEPGTTPTAITVGEQGGKAARAAGSATVKAPDPADPGTTRPGGAPADADPETAEATITARRAMVETPDSAGSETAPLAIADEVPVGGSLSGPSVAVAVAPASLSPSRANDFMQCPLLYRFRVIDRLPEKPSAAATRGTLVHSVLERLFDAPAGERTAPVAKSLIPGQWDRLRESRPEVVELFADDPDGERLSQWLAEAERLVERWFTLEDPTRLEPAERELFVEAELDSGLRLRGIIDRVDVAPTGEVRIVDYKTGKAPRPEYAEGALFQMKFYALVVWRLKNVIPRRLQLVYLGSGDVLTYDPVLADLERVERKLLALWEAIRQATQSGDWRPRPTKLCGWCDHQEHCPEFGGTPPPYPLPVTSAIGEQGRMGPD